MERRLEEAVFLCGCGWTTPATWKTDGILFSRVKILSPAKKFRNFAAFASADQLKGGLNTAARPAHRETLRGDLDAAGPHHFPESLPVRTSEEAAADLAFRVTEGHRD